jgi:ribosomal protein S18 acetylase RimI-like enzyme
MNIRYESNPQLTVDDFINVLAKSTLGLRRPLDNREDMQTMLDLGNYYICAYDGDRLVGLARGMTDFVYTTYLSDLAVDEEYQHLGIGKTLLFKMKEEIPKAKLILLAAPAAEAYYPKIGLERHPHCYYI